MQAVLAAQQRERAIAHAARALIEMVAKDHALAVRAKVVELTRVLEVKSDLTVDILHGEPAAVGERKDIIAVVV